MQNKDFFKGFLLALRLEGLDYIDIRTDEPHRRFDRVAESLRTSSHLQIAGLAMAFFPSSFTGRYTELTTTLCRGAYPYLVEVGYNEVKLDFSPALAQQISKRYTLGQQEAFRHLARTYLAPLSAEEEMLA